MKRIPVILAGEKGEKFWPLSRQNKPNQILPIVTEKALISDTYERLKGFDDFVVVANKNLCDAFKPILSQTVTYFEEPMGRGTATAIGLSCIKLQQKYGDCIMIIEPSDAYHKDLEIYRKEINRACDFCEHQDTIVAIGVKPTAPHTGYNYIKRGIHLMDEIYTVDNFMQNPSIAYAKKLLKDENYFWDMGKFIVKCSVMLEKIKKYMPALYDALIRIKNSKFDSKVTYDEFLKLEKTSIETGVMEQSKKTVVLTSKMDWDEIGDFNAIARVRSPDSNGNFISKEVKMINSSNNIILSDKLVALIGVEDLIIVDTPDALLVCKREDSDKIKDLVKGLDEKYK